MVTLSGRILILLLVAALHAVEPLNINGRTVVPAGSVMRGVVAGVQPATRTNRKARLTLTFDLLTISDRVYPIRATVTQTIEGPGVKGDAGRVAAGAAVGAMLGAILGGGKGAAAGGAAGGGGTLAATEGKEVELKAGRCSGCGSIRQFKSDNRGRDRCDTAPVVLPRSTGTGTRIGLHEPLTVSEKL
jgi:hypothetical protein